MRETWRGIWLVVTASVRAAPRLAVLAFTLEPLGAGVGMLSALYLKWIIDGARTGDASAVVVSAVGLGLVTGLGTALRSVGWRFRTKLLERTGAWIDGRILEMASDLPGIEHIERAEYHDRIQMLEGSNLGNSLFAIIPGLAATVRLVVSAGLLASIHPALALLPLFGLPAVALGIRSQGITHEARERTAHRWRRAAGLYNLTIAAGPAKELRVFGVSGEVRRRHREERDLAADDMARARNRTAVLHAAGWGFFSVGYLGVLALVAVRARQGSATVGDVMLAITVASQLHTSVSELAYEVQDLVGRMRSAAHFLWLEDLVRSSVSSAGTPPPDRLVDGIRFEGVSFTYPGTDVEVLGGVDLFLPAGSRVAIVGDNGAGKTTLVKLLSGFYRPTRGVITVDGVDLSAMDLQAWRERMAAGFQDYCRFELLARQTVGVGDLPRIDSTEAVAGALERAGGAEVADRLAEGLETQLGTSFDDGTELSMGQWQKLALGRAFMRERPLLLILDEPTSSLDAPTEHALFSRYVAVAEERRAEGCITVLVSHRFSTVRRADLIIVVEEGRVCEVGRHDELMAAGGLYSELFSLQADAYR